MVEDVPSAHTEKAYRYIREKILTGEFPPGQLLVLQKLSDTIKVSRTPIRDALRQLEGEGLVVIKHNLGAFVRSIEREEFRELCCLRFAVESYAAREAARTRTEAELLEIERHLDAMREHSQRMLNPRTFKAGAQQEARHDIYFHLAIADASHNRSLKREVMRFCIMHRFVPGEQPVFNWNSPPRSTPQFAAHLETVLAEHKAIADAIRARDSEAARLAMEHHLQRRIDDFDLAGVRDREERLVEKLKL